MSGMMYGELLVLFIRWITVKKTIITVDNTDLSTVIMFLN